MIQAKLLLMVVGIAAVSLGTVGFANSLTVEGVNPIGGASTTVDQLTGGANSKITDTKWTESATASGTIDITAATITVANGDSSSHDYNVCAILSDGGSNPTTLGCTASDITVAASGTGDASVTFSTPIDVEAAKNIDFSIEETS